MHQPHFIVVEGLEGAGKTTAIQTIQEYLLSRAKTITLTREPGGTKLGEHLRTIMKEGMQDETLNPLSELLILYAARAQLVSQVIKPALARGDWVISDRFELSSYAYQGGGRGIDQVLIDTLSAFCVADYQPGLIFFMDVPPELGFERVKKRGKLDKMEQEPLLFFKKVYDRYHQKILEMDNVIVIDASLSLQEVQENLLFALENYLGQKIHV